MIRAMTGMAAVRIAAFVIHCLHVMNSVVFMFHPLPVMSFVSIVSLVVRVIHVVFLMFIHIVLHGTVPIHHSPFASFYSVSHGSKSIQRFCAYLDISKMAYTVEYRSSV